MNENAISAAKTKLTVTPADVNENCKRQAIVKMSSPEKNLIILLETDRDRQYAIIVIFEATINYHKTRYLITSDHGF